MLLRARERRLEDKERGAGLEDLGVRRASRKAMRLAKCWFWYCGISGV